MMTADKTLKARKVVTLNRDYDATAAGRGQVFKAGSRLTLSWRNTYLNEDGDYVEKHYYGMGCALRIPNEYLYGIDVNWES